MNAEMIDNKEMMRDVKRALEERKDKLTDEVESLNGILKMAELLDELLSRVEELEEENKTLQQENEKQRETINNQQEEIEKLRTENKEKDIQIAELSKLSVGVAKKSSQDDLQKAITKYMNVSKRKTISKRITVKTIIMELCNAVGFVMPKEMAETWAALDDEQTDPKIVLKNQGELKVEGDVKVEGDYNDIHDNKAVNF